MKEELWLLGTMVSPKRLIGKSQKVSKDEKGTSSLAGHDIN